MYVRPVLPIFLVLAVIALMQVVHVRDACS